MPFRVFSPGTVFFSLAAAGILSLFGKKRKSSSRSFPEISAQSPLPIPAHDGLRSITDEVFVLDVATAEKTFAYPIGSRLSLSLENERVYLVIEGRKYLLRIPLDSQLKTVLAEGRPYYAYIKERDSKRFSINDIFTVIIYF